MYEQDDIQLPNIFFLQKRTRDMKSKTPVVKMIEELVEHQIARQALQPAPSCGSCFRQMQNLLLNCVVSKTNKYPPPPHPPLAYLRFLSKLSMFKREGVKDAWPCPQSCSRSRNGSPSPLSRATRGFFYPCSLAPTSTFPA